MDELLKRVFEGLGDHLVVVAHKDPGHYFFLSEDERTGEAGLWSRWSEQGELVCFHTSDSAQEAGFSLVGDATLTVKSHPGFSDEADFVAAIVTQNAHWFSERPFCGWKLDVRQTPAGWGQLLEMLSCSDDATQEDVFPQGVPGSIERVVSICDDGNTRLFAVRAGDWMTVYFETS